MQIIAVRSLMQIPTSICFITSNRDVSHPEVILSNRSTNFKGHE